MERHTSLDFDTDTAFGGVFEGGDRSAFLGEPTVDLSGLFPRIGPRCLDIGCMGR